MDAPIDLDGAVPASRQARNCVLQGAKVYPSVVSPDWGTEAVEVHNSLRRVSEQNPRLNTLPSSSEVSATYEAFAQPLKSNLSREVAAQVDAAMGAIIVAEASVARTVPAAVTAAYRTLHQSGTARRGRHADWAELLGQLPLSLEAAEAWEQRETEPGIARFVAALSSALRTPPLAPNELVQPGSGARGEVDDPEYVEVERGPGTGHGRRSDADADVDASRDDEDEKDAPASLVGWLRGRADLSGYLSRFGVEGRWERQTKAELTAVCKGVREALAPDHPDRHFAFFATVCLGTSLPARRSSEIKLSKNTDLWIDVHIGAIRWYLLRLLDAERASQKPLETIDEHHLVDIWLPVLAPTEN
ncbi:MAG: hypothetical protein U1E89_06795 [Burkholderiaceae bacterium]